MIRTLRSTAICLALVVPASVHALTVTITQVDYAAQTNVAATGTASSDGTGFYQSVDPLYGADWSVNVLDYFSGPGPHNWSGVNPTQGAYNYDFTLASNQIAWGTY